MTTIAQAQTALATFEGQIDSLLNTAVDIANPNRPKILEIIKILGEAKAHVHTVCTDAIIKVQALGVA